MVYFIMLEKVIGFFKIMNIIGKIKSFSNKLFVPKITIDNSFNNYEIEIHRSYKIAGSLTRLPEKHEIWLISHVIENGIRTNEYFPQCAGKYYNVDRFPVEYDSQNRRWTGHISIGKEGQVIEVYAVVAPPTSHDFFEYYCKAGGENNYKFVGLKRIPPECKISSNFCNFKGVKRG